MLEPLAGFLVLSVSLLQILPNLLSGETVVNGQEVRVNPSNKNPAGVLILPHSITKAEKKLLA